MRRFSVPLVIVGSAGLLLALVMLWRSISMESEASPSTPQEPLQPGAIATQQPAPAPSLGGPIGARPPLPEIRRRTEERANEPTGDRPALGSETALDQTTDKSSNAIQFGLPQMRAQVAANEPKLNECLAQAQARGDTGSGDATLTFIATKKGDKIVIEDTGVDHDATTIKNDALVDCLHATSKALTFEGLPRNANGVFVTRTVKVENGTLVENKLVKFSYLR